MRYIDAFNHFFPNRFFEGVLDTPAAQKDMGKRIRGIPALWNLEERLRIVDSFPDYSQIISLAMPAIDRLWDPARAPDWARIGNDELAQLVATYPDRFRGYAASLPVNAPEAAAKEAERVLKNGANAIQLHTNVNGAPIDQDAFLPIYEIIEKSRRPILLHPIRTREMADYRTETSSKYEINSVIGWPFDEISGETQALFAGASSAGQFEAGNLRPLAASGKIRSRRLPDLPTIGEFYPGFEVDIWLGLFAPVGTPVEVVRKIREAVHAALSRPDFADKLNVSGSLEPLILEPAAFDAVIRRDHAKYGTLVKQFDIKLD